MQANFHTADTLSCDGLHENPLALGPCKLIGPVGTWPKKEVKTGNGLVERTKSRIKDIHVHRER